MFHREDIATRKYMPGNSEKIKPFKIFYDFLSLLGYSSLLLFGRIYDHFNDYELPVLRRHVDKRIL